MCSCRFCVAGVALCDIRCFSAGMCYTSHSTLYTLHSTLSTLHSALLHSTLHIPHFTLHTPHSTLSTPHFALHPPHLHLILLAVTSVSFTWSAFGFVAFSCFSTNSWVRSWFFYVYLDIFFIFIEHSWSIWFLDASGSFWSVLGCFGFFWEGYEPTQGGGSWSHLPEPVRYIYIYISTMTQSS